jgi:drug/metabolite transporter (DMT)-like permease
MGVLLGLLTALSWGGSDFLARFATRRIGFLRTTLYMQLTGFVLLTISLRCVGGFGHLMDGSGWRPWGWGVLAGTLNGVATLALYRSFETGKMAVVAPLSASYPALTMILAMFTGERLTRVVLLGILLILAGAITVARGEAAHSEGNDEASDAAEKRNSGIVSAVISALGFGVLFWLLGTFIVPAVGYASTVWMIRLTSSVLTTAVILFRHKPISLPRQGSVYGRLLVIGFLDTGAFVLNNVGMLLTKVSVVSVLASLYGAVTVIMAAIFLREHISRWQWCGIVAIFAGIGLISR